MADPDQAFGGAVKLEGDKNVFTSLNTVAIGNPERYVRKSFAPWQQATIEIMLAISLTIACSRYTYNGVILHAHPVRGESHNQRNTTGEVATIPKVVFDKRGYLL